MITTDSGTVRIDGQIAITPAEVTACVRQCAQECTPQVITVTFAQVDLGDCNSCFKQIGFELRQTRNPLFDLPTFNSQPNTLTMVYDPANTDAPAFPSSGIVTGAQIAAYFRDIINNNGYGDTHDKFFITATAAGAVLTLTVPCPYKFEVYQLSGNGLLSTEVPTFTNTPGLTANRLTRDELIRRFPIMIDYVGGQDVNERFFANCESPCVIEIRECINVACLSSPTGQSLGHNAGYTSLSGSNRPTLHIFVNAAAAGYAAFIAALRAAIPTCNTGIV